MCMRIKVVELNTRSVRKGITGIPTLYYIFFNEMKN